MDSRCNVVVTEMFFDGIDFSVDGLAFNNVVIVLKFSNAFFVIMKLYDWYVECYQALSRGKLLYSFNFLQQLLLTSIGYQYSFLGFGINLWS